MDSCLPGPLGTPRPEGLPLWALLPQLWRLLLKGQLRPALPGRSA